MRDCYKQLMIVISAIEIEFIVLCSVTKKII